MRTVLRTRATSAAAFAVSLASLVGGGIVLAPNASAAVGCETNVTNHWRTVTDLGGGNVRTGPGETYKRLYTLDFADYFLAVCYSVNSHGNRWYYGKDGNERKGWIFADRTEKGRF